MSGPLKDRAVAVFRSYDTLLISRSYTTPLDSTHRGNGRRYSHARRAGHWRTDGLDYVAALRVLAPKSWATWRLCVSIAPPRYSARIAWMISSQVSAT